MANLFAISVVGCDEPGIVASISKVLLELDCNLADTNMSVLSGHFAMILIVEAPEQAPMTGDILLRALEPVKKRFELTISAQPLRESRWPRFFAPEPAPKAEKAAALVTVYGADRPGIVHYVTEAIAATRSNIIDLRTQQTSAERRLYSLFMEVELPADQSRESLAKALGPVAKQCGVEVAVQDLEPSAL